MKFVDETRVTAVAGSGGSGCCSFFRAKYKPRGAPDGGDGGNGGSVVFAVDMGLLSLADIRNNSVLRAANGANGGKRCCNGAAGEDLLVPMPPGTLVYDQDSGEMLGDLTESGQTLVVASGGTGGIGNAKFKSSTNRSPQRTIPAGVGEQVSLRMELRLLADVGLLGLANAGKSSLLAAISRATPKIGAYPFTTLNPQLGMVRVGASFSEREFSVADIPGLIKGAATGAGLGNRFLRHLRRTGLLLHVVDCSSGAEQLMPQIGLISEELRQAGGFAEVPLFYVCNKIDLLSDQELRLVEEKMREICGAGRFFMLSALTGDGCDELCGYIAQYLRPDSAADGDSGLGSGQDAGEVANAG